MTNQIEGAIPLALTPKELEALRSFAKTVMYQPTANALRRLCDCYDLYRQALEKYANSENWEYDGNAEIGPRALWLGDEFDGFKLAEDALNAKKEVINVFVC